MNNWITSTLKEVSQKIITGPFGSQLHQSDYIDSGIAVIMPQNIEDRYVNYNSIAYISENDADRLSRYKAKTHDIVYSRRGDVEKHALIRDKDPESFCGTGCFLVRLNTSKVHPEFISFYLNRPESRTWLRQHAVGSNMPNLNSEILNNVPICYPEGIETQKKLVEGISSLDLKINLNNIINAELEKLAKTLYNYWFVQFDFPNANGKPYCASCGKMEYSEVLKREIPKGWGVKSLSELCEMYQPKTISAKEFLPYGEYSVYGANGIIGYYDKYNHENSELLITCRGATCGNIHYTEPKCWITGNAMVVKPKVSYITKEYLLLYFENNDIIKNIITGSAQPQITRSNLEQLNILLPSANIASHFQDIIFPMYTLSIKNRLENQQLIKLRDFLLPLLMNGQVRVDNSKKIDRK